MRCRLLLAFSLLMAYLPSACVSFNEYMAVESDLKDSRNQTARADKKIRDLEAEIARRQQETSILKSDLRRAEAAANRCSRELTDLQARHAYLKNINQQMSQNAERLQRDIQNKKSVIVLQDKVIQLLDDAKKTIRSSLQKQIAAKDIELVETRDQLKMVLVDTILFESGSTEISKKGKALLLVIAESIRDLKDQNVMVAGHTDNKPLGARLKKRFPSNWELSSARAAAVARFLQLQGKLNPKKLSTCGYSYYQPVASNKTEKGRRQNRRIEIILSPQEPS
jgi:chemotaxis protein MotB